MNEKLLIKGNICAKLKLIGQVKQHQKINTNTFDISNDNISTALSRSYYTLRGIKGYSRNDLFNCLKSTLDDAYKFLADNHKNTNSQEKLMCISIRNDITNAKNNILTNIKETYANDPPFVARLEEMVDSIDIQLKVLDGV